MATGFDGHDGAELLLQAAQCLKRDSVACEFLIAGEGRHEKRLRRHARSLGVRSRVNFVPPLVDLVSALEDLDVAVVVSQGPLRVLSILEAQAAGRAVVATAVPGIDEFIEDGVTGLVVHDDGAQALARSIEELLEDAEFGEQLGAHARQRVIETAGLDRMLDGVESVYASMLVRAGSRAP
jgi:glycosyltransferase involved in cell wall biosynthesis